MFFYIKGFAHTQILKCCITSQNPTSLRASIYFRIKKYILNNYFLINCSYLDYSVVYLMIEYCIVIGSKQVCKILEKSDDGK